MARRASHVVVAGDLCIDWISVPVDAEPTGEANEGKLPNWRLHPSTRMVARGGGALLLKRLIEEAVQAASQITKVSGIQLDQLESRSATEVIHSMVVLDRYPLAAGKEDDKERVYRIREFGGSTGPVGAMPTIYRRCTIEDSKSANVVVLDDAGNGFRESAGCWPSAVRDQSGSPLVLLKVARPLAEGTLWRSLLRHHRERLIVVMDAKDLRAHGANISCGISWERTAADTAWHLSWNPVMKPLRHCSHLIVRFGCEGALYGRICDDQHEFRLFYDPLRIEGETRESTPGGMTGLNSVFCATVAKHLATHGLRALDKGIKEGIQRSNILFRLGYGPKASDVDYPCRKVFRSSLQNERLVADARVPAPGDSAASATGMWSIAADHTGANLTKSCHDLVILGFPADLKQVPAGTFGKLTTVDRNEIESYRSIRNLILEYIRTPNPERPLSIAVFGQPGSGKSFGVTQVATSLDPKRITKKGLEFNISQFQDVRDLVKALHKVRDVVLAGMIPLVFFDEFDSSAGDTPLGWLKYFLMPMQDGAFRDGEVFHSIGKCIFVFAGGTCSTFKQFSEGSNLDGNSEKAERVRKSAKVPDFVSRLRGFVDVAGPNQVSGEDGLFRVRRAILLRSLLWQKRPHLFDKKKRLQIDPYLVDALLGVPTYRHGARSMEAIIDMSMVEQTSFFDQGALPPTRQLDLHVDAELFLELLHLGPAIDDLAREIHNEFRRKQRSKASAEDPAMQPWNKLSEHFRESNRLQAMHIPAKLRPIGYMFAPRTSNKPSATFTEDEVLKLAIMEHDRFVAERLLAGWRRGKERDPKKKISPYLVPWEKLDPDAQKKDLDAVCAIPRLLDKAGFELHRL